MKYAVSILLLITGILGVFFTTFKFERKTNDAQKRQENFLKLAVPETIGAMTSKDVPLGNTEEVSRASERILELSDWLYREYTLPNGGKFQIYIAYWEPNKLDVRYTSSHSPDRCWVKNGWKNIDDKKRHDYPLHAKKGDLMPAYYREYTFKSDFASVKRNVWFWLIVDGKRYDFGSDAITANPISYIKHSFSDALKGAPEQFFVRIDSDDPLENLLKDADFKTLLDILGDITLYPKKGE